MAVNDDLLDALTRHEVYLRRYGTATLREVLELLQGLDSTISERVLGAGSELSRTRQEKLLADIKRVMKTAYTDATGALSLNLDELAAYEGEYQTDLFNKTVPVKLEVVTPSADQLAAAVKSKPFEGKLLSEVYADLSASSFRKVRDTIRGGFVEGRTTEQIVRDLRGRASLNYKDGVISKTRRDVESVVRTAINHTANTARELHYTANDDLVKGVRWNSTLDGRTTLICMGRDGKVYPPNEGPRPPAHFGCRSATSPILKSWKELGIDLDEAPEGTRASMNGQVPADQDYDTFLRKQSRDFQDEVLGPSRATLFRSGTKVDRFTDASGREYTLAELRRREGV